MRERLLKCLWKAKVRTIQMFLSGYTRKNKLVNFIGPKSAIGRLVNVKIIEAKTWTLSGEMVKYEELS